MKMAKTIGRYPKSVITFLVLLFFVPSEQNECSQKRCSPSGPAIRFPFRIKGVELQHCGYSQSFDVSCNKENNTLLQLRSSEKLLIKKIDYKSQTIHLSDPQRCLPRLFRNINVSVSPFEYKYNQMYLDSYTVISCSPESFLNSYGVIPLPSCVNGSENKLYAVQSSVLSIDDMLSCTKMYEIPSIHREILEKNTELRLFWSKPDCSKCEAKHRRCRLNSSATTARTECYGAQTSDGVSKLVISASVIGSFVLALVLFCVIQKYKAKEENQVKVEQFLADYEAFKPTRYSYADIKRITSQLSNVIGEGAYGTVYRGKLSNEILVAVKVLNNSMGKGEEFLNEVEIISKIHHVNIVRMVGFCADGFRRALVYEFLPNGSLQNFIDPTNRKRSEFLKWERMRHIALGIAKGIEYLHQGCDQRILHFDIKPQNVLLDNNLNPKVSDFGTAKLCSKDQSMVSMTAARGTVGYIAPEVFARNFGGVSYKSDVYSFGILLLEIVGSKRKNVNIPSTNGRECFMPEWIYRQLEDGIQNVEFDDTEEEEDVKIVRNLAIVGLWCIQWRPVDRPSMSKVLKMLEGKEDLSMPSNPFVKGPFPRNNNSVANSPRDNYVEQELSVISE